MTTERELARQQIKHHEAAAARNPHKRAQHLESIRYLREKYSIPEPPTVRAGPPGTQDSRSHVVGSGPPSGRSWFTNERYVKK